MTKESSANWQESLPALKIQTWNDGCLLLEQDDGAGNIDRVAVHPLHLRLMAEKMGLVGTLSDTEARALRMVEKLSRRMGLLHERIKQVQEWLWQNKDFTDCDITVEAWYSDATLDLSKEFMAEIEESRAVVAPGAKAAGGRVEPSSKACAAVPGGGAAKASVKAPGPFADSLFSEGGPKQ